MSFCYPAKKLLLFCQVPTSQNYPYPNTRYRHVTHSLETEIAYTSILLAISATFPFLTRILDLAAALTYDQDSFMGKMNGIPTKGATFLAQLPLAYGVSIQEHRNPKTKPKPSLKTTDTDGETQKSLPT